ncbi:MAG: PAS domain S-box protein [Armatimonadia bacterium]
MMGSGSALDIDCRGGDHTCHFYRSDDERYEVLLGYVLAGLQRHEQVVCLLGEAAHQQLLQCLDDNGYPAQSYLASQQLLILEDAATYTPDGQFVPDRMLSALHRLADAAVAASFDGVRAVGDVSWLADGVPGAEAFGAYEAEVTRLLRHDSRFTCLCQLNQERVPPALQQEILLTHPLVISNSHLVRNPFHVDPETFLSPEREGAIVNSWLQNLEACQKAEEDLRASEQWSRPAAAPPACSGSTCQRLRGPNRRDRAPQKCAQLDTSVARQQPILQAVFDSAGLGIALGDEHSTIQRANPAFARMLGYEAEELIGLGAEDFTHPDDLQADMELLAELREGKRQDFALEKRFIHRDGTVVWGHLTVTEVQLGEAGERYMLALIEDISEAKATAAELASLADETRRRADELETVVNSIADGVAMYDAEGRITRLNAAGRRLMEYTEADLALPLSERASILPPLREDGTEYAPDEVPTARSLRGETVSHETMCLRWADGSHTWVRASCMPVRDAEGNITGVVSSFHDLTALREHQGLTERLLQEVEEQRARVQQHADELDTIVSSIADAVSVCDAKGNLIRTNDTARRLLRYGQASDYRIRTSRCDYYRPDGSLFTFGELPLTRSLGGDTVIGETVRMAWPDGTSTWVSSTSAPLLDAAGTVTGAVLTNTEITRLREAQEQVQQERERFLSLLGMLPGYVAVLSPGHYFTYVNQRFVDLFGDPADQKCYHALFGRNEPCEVCRSFEPLQTGKPVIWEWNAPSGQIFEVYDHPFTDLDGSPLVLEFGMDITERKRDQEEVRRHRDHLEDLVAHRTQELVEHQDRLRLVASQLALAEEKERKRIATAIHDDLSQTLAFAKLRLSVIRHSGDPATMQKDLALLEELLGEAIASSRRLMFELSPPILYEMGLATAIEWLARRVAEVHSIEVEVSLSSRDLAFSQEWQVTIFQAVRELLNNAAKHAQASKVRIFSSRSSDCVEVTVEDDGCGFNAQAIHVTDSSGFGLFNLHERLTHMGGDLRLVSDLGTGTAVTLTAPLPK